MADVHSDLWLLLVRTPIQELIEQLQMSADDAGISMKQFVKNVHAGEKLLCPRDLKGGSRKHFHFVLLAARLLVSEGERRLKES